MATVQGLNLREGRYHLCIIVPIDLVKVYGKRRFNPALGTSDRKEAIFKGHLERAKWLADFEIKRRELNPQAVESVTPELAQAIADGVRSMVLSGDDSLREDFKVLRELARIASKKPVINSLQIPVDPPRDELAGMTIEEAEGLAWLNSSMSDLVGSDYAINNLRAALPWAQEAAKRLGLTVDERTPGIRDALRLSLASLREAREDATRRDAGKVIPTPLMPEPPTSNSEPKETPSQTLRDVFDRWVTSGSKPRSNDSRAATDRALRLFESQHPTAKLSDFTPDLGDRYRSWLLTQSSISPKTARDQFNALKSLLKYAFEVLEWMPRQPWRALSIEAKATTQRRPWKDDELTRLFSTPLHSNYELPKSKQAGKDAAYWVPLLGLYTGARLGELCQLRALDVQQVEGIHVLTLTDEGEGQTIKTDAGHRSVPIHSELIRLGFLDYVEQIRKSNAASLWPEMSIREGKPSDYFSRWFLRFRHSVGLTEDYPDFHCFRHTIRPQMRRARISESTMDKITGHETLGSVGTVVYDHWQLEELQQAIETLKYPTVNLQRVFKLNADQ